VSSSDSFDTSLYERLALSRDKAGYASWPRRVSLWRSRKTSSKSRWCWNSSAWPAGPLFEFRPGRGHHQPNRTIPAGDGQRASCSRPGRSASASTTDHFFVDLVFYNRLLRCYVLVDLKLASSPTRTSARCKCTSTTSTAASAPRARTGPFGIVLCTKKNQALVTITLPKGARIHARGIPIVPAQQGSAAKEAR